MALFAHLRFKALLARKCTTNAHTAFFVVYILYPALEYHPYLRAVALNFYLLLFLFLFITFFCVGGSAWVLAFSYPPYGKTKHSTRPHLPTPWGANHLPTPRPFLFFVYLTTASTCTRFLVVVYMKLHFISRSD